MSSISIRPGEPSVEEGLQYAYFLNIAGEGFFHFWLGKQADQIIAKAYLQPTNEYSFENVVFAIRDETIVGMAAGFSVEKRHSFSKQPIREAAIQVKFRKHAILRLLGPMLPSVDKLAKSDFYLQSIAVDENAFGQGIGSDLLSKIEERALEDGAKRIVLDVSGGNHRARRFYEKRNYTIESVTPSLPMPKRFRATRMVNMITK